MRNLEREIGAVCRKVARRVAEGRAAGTVAVVALFFLGLATLGWWASGIRRPDPVVGGGADVDDEAVVDLTEASAEDCPVIL